MYPLRVGVTMSLHKLTAGAGYDYLTRQVAALDSTEKGHTGLASYYTERGETPGVWIGSGMDGIDGLTAGDPVTAGHMRALFGCGLHPLAELRQQQLEGPDLSPRDYQDAALLGRRSGSLTAMSARSGLRSPAASRRSMRQLAFRRAPRCQPQIGRGCGPTWPASSSWPNMAGSPPMPESWRDRSRETRGRGHRRLLVMT
jgi:hypothetical protein